ncbi:conserved hypothetical protein [Methanosalsum zhilinae DSM 4017]|uniref:Carboxypeptidase regulatory-like domain-containing protein n=1 Tax=Methanosalsum zhilinae (strain DSM 4017 / NBRC 107636 / OCM 62 / WeN5) TaxID=679901 RepID=F7XMK1_METZD|nr:hypothetical protein [Methanosalsum zhilinae]AEH59927.1 conserved hypothetical protein [Methanosalsum zhilinae DSM 4017]
MSILRDDRASIGLPMRMVVLTTIGLIGLFAIIGTINQMPVPPQPMYAIADTSYIELQEGMQDPELVIHVYGYDDIPVSGASVVVWDPSKENAYTDVTCHDGKAHISMNSVMPAIGNNQGYISIKVMADGYVTFEDKYFVKVLDQRE